MFGWISTFLHWKGISKAPSCTSHSISLCDNGFLQMQTAKLKKTAEKVSHCLVRTQTAAQLSTLKRCSFIQTKSSSIGPKFSIASIDARCHSETWPWRFTNFPPFCTVKAPPSPVLYPTEDLQTLQVKIHTCHIYFDVGHFTLGSWQQLEKLEKKEMSSKKRKI